MLPAELAFLNPDADAILTLLRARVDDAMLRSMAEADYGFDADENMAALAAIRATGDLSAELDWNPGEVLRLCRWGTLDTATPAAELECFHLARGFACAVLIRAAIEPANAERDSALDNSVAPLVESAIALGTDYALAAARALLATARHEAALYDDDLLLCGIGAVICACALPHGVLPPDTPQSLARWLLELEQRLGTETAQASRGPRALRRAVSGLLHPHALLNLARKWITPQLRHIILPTGEEPLPLGTLLARLVSDID